MARRTAEEAEKTRQALLAAGVAMFADRGFANVALEDVIAEVGVTRGALYHHFSSKRAFFHAVVEGVQSGLAERIVLASERLGDGWVGIEAGCDRFLEAAVDPVYRRIVLIDAPAALGWKEWKRLDDRHLTRSLREGLQQLRLDGQLESDDAEALAVALSGAMNELALWVAHHDEPEAAMLRARRAILTLVRALRPLGG